MLPVDYVSRAILALSLRDEMLGRSVNLVNEKYREPQFLWRESAFLGPGLRVPLAESAF